MANKKEDTVRGPVRGHKIGDTVILGTDQDFPESPVAKLSVRYDEDKEKKRRSARREASKRTIDPIRNRFDRMKSYCLKNKILWDVDWWDYKRLWEQAPDIFDPEKGRMVPAKEFVERRGKLRACRISPRQKYVDVTNLVLKLGGDIHYGPLIR